MLYSPTFFSMAVANLSCLASFSVFYLFPLFITQHGGDKADVGIIMGATALASVVFRPWISEMIDRMGRKRSYTLGSFLMTVLPLVYLYFDGTIVSFYLPLLIIRIVHGIGFAVCITAAFTFVADLVPKDRLNEGIGMFGVSGLVGSALGPAVAELIIRRFDFDTLFYSAAGFSLIGLLVHLPLTETYIHTLKTVKVPFFAVLKQGRILGVAVIAVLFGIGLAAVNNFVSPFAHAVHLSFISVYYVAYSTAAILTRVGGARLVDSLGEDRIIPYALLLTGLGLMSMVFLGGTGVLFAAGLLTGCGHGILYPSLNVRAIRGQPIEIRGKIVGVYTGSIDAGVFAGSIILGYVGDLLGFRVLFLSAGVALLAGLGIFAATAGRALRARGI
ncbi:MFS transporter [Syntrophobacter fumaroxidans]|uniref:Major facilitator superfamily MFS_1 n=1 Tax=Syntrophobacter fumaroxidans (strain DSM 10017 / MPOB) TaxID=335543 RepID=A0LEU0_SYNFM|nr:MFS transporter [Syntrophobacter fumaroxidans]ABK15942.1 major facilitator superfamily MFS_1 [Syntrophobacter fumaroxidans MPOB]